MRHIAILFGIFVCGTGMIYMMEGLLLLALSSDGEITSGLFVGVWLGGFTMQRGFMWMVWGAAETNRRIRT